MTKTVSKHFYSANKKKPFLQCYWRLFVCVCFPQTKLIYKREKKRKFLLCEQPWISFSRFHFYWEKICLLFVFVCVLFNLKRRGIYYTLGMQKTLLTQPERFVLKRSIYLNSQEEKLFFIPLKFFTHTHTHIYMYIYIYIYEGHLIKNDLKRHIF